MRVSQAGAGEKVSRDVSSASEISEREWRWKVEGIKVLGWLEEGILENGH